MGALRTLCSDVRADGPSPLELADVSHLATTVTARADADTTSIADLVAALHPTPAVAGTPREVALDAIDAMEPVARGRYAGPCGWIDRNGAKYGLSRPMPGADPAHVQSGGSWHKLASAMREARLGTVDDKRGIKTASATEKSARQR